MQSFSNPCWQLRLYPLFLISAVNIISSATNQHFCAQLLLSPLLLSTFHVVSPVSAAQCQVILLLLLLSTVEIVSHVLGILVADRVTDCLHLAPQLSQFGEPVLQ